MTTGFDSRRLHSVSFLAGNSSLVLSSYSLLAAIRWPWVVAGSYPPFVNIESDENISVLLPEYSIGEPSSMERPKEAVSEEHRTSPTGTTGWTELRPG
jgi:hypothetical protein